MGYSNFKSLRQALERLDIEEFIINLFSQIQPVEPSDWLKQSLQLAKSMPLTNEKSKSERVISPILLEVSYFFKDNVTLYSGEDLYIDEKRDLAGACDFFLAKHPLKSVMQAPIITLAEAKNEDMDYGKGQCLAQMYISIKLRKSVTLWHCFIFKINHYVANFKKIIGELQSFLRTVSRNPEKYRNKPTDFTRQRKLPLSFICKFLSKLLKKVCKLN